MSSKSEIRLHLYISFQHKQLLKNIQKLWVLSLVNQQRPLQLFHNLYITIIWDLNRLETIKRSRDIQNESVQEQCIVGLSSTFYTFILSKLIKHTKKGITVKCVLQLLYLLYTLILFCAKNKKLKEAIRKHYSHNTFSKLKKVS